MALSRIGILVSLSLFSSLHSLAQVSFYNRHYYEIKDTKTYKPYFYATLKEDSSERVKEFFKMDSTLAMRRVDVLDEKQEAISTKWTYFEAEGWVSRETGKTYLPKDSTHHTYFYPNGMVKEIKLIVNNYIISHKYFDESSQERSVTITDPEPEGGMFMWYEYLKKNLAFPKKRLKDGTTGTVRIWLEMEENGKITVVEVMNPEQIHADFQKEALRVVNGFVAKPWTPRTENGTPQKSFMILPIAFKLEDGW